MRVTFDLSGQRALVTGGASGIGLGAVRTLARCGARVAVNDLAGTDKLDTVVAGLAAEGLEVVAAPGDVGDSIDGPRMVRQAIADLGGLDYLVNNAGTPGTTQPIPPGDFDRQDEAF